MHMYYNFNMKVLVCNLFESLTSKTIQKYLRKLGYHVSEKTYYTPDDLYGDERIEKTIAKDIKLIRPDFVFTINFWPPVARACKKANTKYISYAYDSPQNIPKDDDMDYETNYIFLFDKDETEKYRSKGIDRVYHAPLATDVELWDKADFINYNYDISLIGMIYESTFPSLMAGMDEYYKGYFKGVIAAQQQIYGYYMVDDVIRDKMDEVNRIYKELDPDTNVTLNQMSYSVGSYVTYLDRVSLLRLMQKAGNTHLFTGKITDSARGLLSNVNIHGYVDYETQMPIVFKSSKINLNPILRVIRTGIPQRALDVMGCNAFLLSSFQPELADFFVPDEEVVMYNSYEDAVEKASFYLKNEDLRKQIALKGYEKIKQFFTYDVRLSQILSVAGFE